MVVEDADSASEPSHHSKSVAQSRDIKSPVAAAGSESRKRQAQKVSLGHSKTKARKSDSAIILARDKRSSSSRASVGDANVGKHGKATSRRSMHRRSAGYNKVTSGREEDSIKVLSAERRRLEKENQEKKRQLEQLRKQERLLIEAAAKKGGEWFVAQ